MLKTKESKGITLIALIITIIVLLILAGVTISAISGNESAMEKAKQAKEKNEQGAELDAIKSAVVNSVASDLTGLVNAENLKEGLNGIVEDEGRLKINQDNSPWIVTGKTGMKYKINQNGEVTPVEPVASVEFVNTTDSIEVGKSKKLEIVVKGASGNITEANEITFISSNTNIATAENDGTITIVDDENFIDETITISVLADNVNGSNKCTITVKRFMPYAKDVLTVTVTNEGTDNETVSSPKYVNYTMANGTKVNCRVLYNDETYGVQIIPINGICNVTLGKTDEEAIKYIEDLEEQMRENKELSEDGYIEDRDFEIARFSYNNAVTKLNRLAKTYINTQLSDFVRCMGSDPSEPQYDNSLYYTPYYAIFKNWIGTRELKKGDSKYQKDLNRLNKINHEGFKSGWLVSRTVWEGSLGDTFNCRFRFYSINGDGTPFPNDIIVMQSYRGDEPQAYAFSVQKKLFPIFNLKDNVKISSGEGTKLEPYELITE